MLDIESFKSGADALAGMLRAGQDEAACYECGRMLQLLIPFMPQMSAGVQGEMLALSKLLLQCQERHDWFGLCDYLEFELPVLLDRLAAELS